MPPDDRRAVWALVIAALVVLALVLVFIIG